MCKKVLINPETESFINDLKREYNNSIVKPYKKTRDVLEILMKKFVLSLFLYTINFIFCNILICILFII